MSCGTISKAKHACDWCSREEKEKWMEKIKKKIMAEKCKNLTRDTRIS